VKQGFIDICFTRIIARIERMTSDPPEMSSQLRSSAPALV